MTSLPEFPSVDGEWLKSSPPENVRSAAERDVAERTLRLSTVIVIMPITIAAAATMAMRAEMLRIFFLWPKACGIESGVEAFVSGSITIGLGRTEAQDLLTAAPQSDGLLDTEDGEMVLKNPPPGSSPCSWLCEMLNDKRCTRLASCFGRLPVSLLKDRSTCLMAASFASDAGKGPVRSLCERILQK